MTQRRRPINTGCGKCIGYLEYYVFTLKVKHDLLSPKWRIWHSWGGGLACMGNVKGSDGITSSQVESSTWVSSCE